MKLLLLRMSDKRFRDVTYYDLHWELIELSDEQDTVFKVLGRGRINEDEYEYSSYERMDAHKRLISFWREHYQKEGVKIHFEGAAWFARRDIENGALFLDPDAQAAYEAEVKRQKEENSFE